MMVTIAQIPRVIWARESDLCLRWDSLSHVPWKRQSGPVQALSPPITPFNNNHLRDCNWASAVQCRA